MKLELIVLNDVIVLREAQKLVQIFTTFHFVDTIILTS